MDANKLIIWFLGLAVLIAVGLVGTLAFRRIPLPECLDHIAVGAVGALAGAMAVKSTDSKP